MKNNSDNIKNIKQDEKDNIKMNDVMIINLIKLENIVKK